MSAYQTGKGVRSSSLFSRVARAFEGIAGALVRAYPSNSCKLLNAVCQSGAIASLGLTTLVHANIELSLSSLECMPGDLVELRAVSAFEEYTAFELMLPEYPSLHLVAHQNQPLSYSGGIYRQEDIWVFQPMQSGVVELDGIKALLHAGAKTSEQILPKQVLTVVPYSVSDDSFAVEALPEPIAERARYLPGWSYVIFALGAVAILLIALRPKGTARQVTIREAPTLADLMIAIQEGKNPRALVEQLVCDPNQSLSDELRQSMESVVYAHEPDWSSLEQSLKKEVVS